MTVIKPEDLKKAYKKEKNLKISRRMAAVNMVCVYGKSMQETADYLMQCPNWVDMWVRRFKEGGLDALRDLPKSGRPCKVQHKRMDKIVNELVSQDKRTTPVMLQQEIKKKTGIKFHITYVRKIMHQYNLTPKRPNRIHINSADSKAVSNWKYRTKKIISRLKKKGFNILVQDESFFVHDAIQGRKYWSLCGTPVSVPYIGRHKTTVVFGAIADDKRQIFRTGFKFNKETFVKYLGAMLKKFGKIAVILDRAPAHRAKLVRKFQRCHKDRIKLIYLPKGSPYLNAVEECWYQSKRDCLVSEYYPTFENMCIKLSSYLRTTRYNLDIYKYLNRTAIASLKNI